MAPQLVALTEGPNILLDKPILLLGRHQDCDIQLGSRKVSRRHCCLAQVNGFLVVRDLGSTNGIRINGVRVMEGNLRAGDELTIGNQRYQLQWVTKASEPAPKPVADLANAVQPPSMVGTMDGNFVSGDNPVALPEPGFGVNVPIGIAAAPPVPVNQYDDSHQPPGQRAT